MDKYGMPVFDTPDNEVIDNNGDLIDVGVVDHWENEVEGLKNDPDALNEFYRQFPRTEEHAFRDETKNSIFNLIKICFLYVYFQNNIKNYLRKRLSFLKAFKSMVGRERFERSTSGLKVRCSTN